MPRTHRPEEVAPGVHRLDTGSPALGANVYLVDRGDGGWVLVDTGWARHASLIRSAADALHGRAGPEAIVLTHIHPDHSGAARALAHAWDVPVLVHPEEMPLVPGGYLPEYAHPLDRRVVGPLLRLVPPERLEAARVEASLEGIASAFDPDRGVEALPGWTCVPTPGHTPGHTAFFRAADGVLITGDAVLTVDLNSVAGVVGRQPCVAGPPWYTTWAAGPAHRSVRTLAALEPRVLAPGHGPPLVAGGAAALAALAEGVSVRPRATRRTTRRCRPGGPDARGPR